MQAKPAEQKEDDDAGPKNPLVLFSAPLDHAYGVAADAERVGHAVQSLLGVLEHIALRAQVSEYGLASALLHSQVSASCPEGGEGCDQ